MANTNYLKNDVETWVRDYWLAGQFPKKRFTKKTLKLRTGGNHEFDAVSQDNSIIAGIKTNSGKTSGGNPPSGKYAVLFQELYFLSLVQALRKLLVLTNKDMYKAFQNNSSGKIAEGIEIVFCQLPQNIREKVASIQAEASGEQSKK